MKEPEQFTPGAGPALGAAGPCPTVTHRDKTWHVGHPTQKAKAELEMLVIEIAQRNIDELKARIGPVAYERKCSHLDLQVEAGHHRTWGPLWRAVNAGPDGVKLFFLSLLKEKHPEATFALVEELFMEQARPVSRAMAVVMPAFFILLSALMPATSEERAAQVAAMLGNLAESYPPEPLVVTSDPTPSAPTA